MVSFDTSSTNKNYSAYLVDSKVDSQGNIYLLGRFYDSMNVLGTVISSAGGLDTFIIKLNSDGDLLFAKRYGGTGDTYSRAIEVDSSGNIYFTGYLSEGSFTIDNFTAGPANNMVYTIKLNSSGERIWSMFGAANNGHNFFTDLALSNNENSIYVTGGSYDSFAYGSNSQSIGNGANTGLSALFFELSTSNGAVGSVITTGGTNCNCVAEQVIIDDSNNIYVAGIHAGTLDLTNDIGQSFASKGSYDIFVWKDFVPTAAISIGSESNDVIHDLKFDSNGNLLLGIKYGSSFDVSNNFSLTSENENAIIKVNSSLQFLLGYEIPNSSGSTISNIAVSQNGTIYSNYGNSSGSKIEKLDTNLNSLRKS